MNSSTDPRRQDKVNRYKPPVSTGQAAGGEDLMPDYMNILGTVLISTFISLIPIEYLISRNGILNVWSYDEIKMVRLAGPVLLVHQFRELTCQR